MRWRATYSASRPAPASSIEGNAYWKDRPQKYSPGTSSDTPRYSRGHPFAPRMGRSIQSKVWRKPVAQITLTVSTVVPSASSGSPSRTP